MSNLAEHRHRWTRSEYAMLADAAEKGLRCELINGEIVDVSPMSNRHRQAVANILNMLARANDDRAFFVGCQMPIVVSDHSEPEPDVWIARGPSRDYDARSVMASDLVLAVEVSDTTLRFDRDVKVPLYAAAGIPEVWLVDVNAETVEIHREPRGEAYATKQTVGADGVVPMPWGGELIVDHMLHGVE